MSQFSCSSFDFLDTGDFSSGSDFLHSFSDFGKGGKCLVSGLEEDEIEENVSARQSRSVRTFTPIRAALTPLS
jgi:hypothetical protein